jgi:hypothetical protein
MRQAARYRQASRRRKAMAGGRTARQRRAGTQEGRQSQGQASEADRHAEAGREEVRSRN